MAVEEPPNRTGMKWVNTLWGLQPRWTVKLDKMAIQTTVQAALELRDPCTVTFLAKGAFNRLYIIGYVNQIVIMRISMPILPKWKTESEVATINWVRQNTSLPVPRIIAFTSDCLNPTGFEWIIMEKMAGKPLADAWWEIDFSAKQHLVCRIALFCSETFQTQMKGIGSLFSSTSDISSVQSISLGPLVSGDFVTKSSVGEIRYGPFASSAEWTSALLDLAETDCRHRLALAQRIESESTQTKRIEEANSHNEEHQDDNHEEDGEEADEEDDESDEDEDDEEDPDELEKSLVLIGKLRAQINKFFPERRKADEPTIVVHDDLNKHNILVDVSGKLTAVVDWECISTQPLSVACDYPSFIKGKPSTVEPIKSKYQHDENGNVAELYWEHREHYELHQLRGVFLEEMRKLEPRWVEVFESSQRQRDFIMALSGYDDPLMMRRLLSWLTDLESGGPEVISLEDRIDNCTL